MPTTEINLLLSLQSDPAKLKDYCLMLSQSQRHATLNIREAAIYISTLHQPGFSVDKTKRLFTSDNRLFRLDNVNKHPDTGKVMERRRRATVANIDRVFTLLATAGIATDGRIRYELK